MLYLILTIVFSTSILVTFRIVERFKVDNLQAIIINYLVAVLIGAVMLPSSHDLTTIFTKVWFPYSILAGVFFILGFFIFALSSQKVGIAITAVSSKMSLVVPIIFSVIVFGEILNIITIVGVVIALLAFYLTFKKEEKRKIVSIYFFLPLFLFLCNGINDTLMKFIETTMVNGDTLLFLTTIFAIAFFIGCGFLLAKYVMGRTVRLESKNVVAGLVLGLFNFLSTYFFLKGVTEFDSVVFFPIYNVSVVALSALIGYFSFKERLRLINWVGIVCAAIAIVVIAVGA